MLDRLRDILPWIGLAFAAGILLHALFHSRREAGQWPGRLGRFLFAIIAGVVTFAIIYIVGGFIVSKMGYTYNDKPLQRLAHLVCLLGVYPAALLGAVKFRTRHVSLIIGILLVIFIHLWDHWTYFGRMVFDDPGLPLNGDFALTNMALMLVASLLGGEAGLRAALPSIYARAAEDAEDAPEAASLTSGGG